MPGLFVGALSCRCCAVHSAVAVQGMVCAGQQLSVSDFVALLHKAGADACLASEKWVQEQMRWITWKCAAYQAQFPDVLKGRLLNAAIVLDQLKFRQAATVPKPSDGDSSQDERSCGNVCLCARRYEWEHNRNRRSILKRIIAGDASAGHAMVLRISSVCDPGEALGTAAAAPRLEVTDGWYSVRAAVDPPLAAIVRQGRLRPGKPQCQAPDLRTTMQDGEQCNLIRYICLLGL